MNKIYLWLACKPVVEYSLHQTWWVDSVVNGSKQWACDAPSMQIMPQFAPDLLHSFLFNEQHEVHRKCLIQHRSRHRALAENEVGGLICKTCACLDFHLLNTAWCRIPATPQMANAGDQRHCCERCNGTLTMICGDHTVTRCSRIKTEWGLRFM